MTDSRRGVLLWGGLAVAFSPVLQDLAETLGRDPHQRYVLLPLVLIGLLLASGSRLRHGPHFPGVGIALLVLGLTAEMLGIAAGSWLIARWGLPVAMLGVSLLLAGPDPRILILTFGLVPLPDFLTHATSPGFESMLGTGAAWALDLLGFQLKAGGPLLHFDGARFELQAADSGIVTAVLLAEVGWYSALRADLGLSESIRRALGGALLAVVVQPILVFGCVATLVVGLPELGRFLLTYGVAIFLGVAVIARFCFSRFSNRAD